MEFLFLSLYDYFQRQRTVFYCVLVALFALAGLGASQITIEEDVSKFFPNDTKIDKLTRVFQDSKLAEKLVVMVSLTDSTTMSVTARSDLSVTRSTSVE